ncbi:MAG TPA: Npt1/Npt2 family nucleotide transporter [Vicinamibacterales bacterium]|nr:Npt1/Npt2 family nucleotide transporter [Vicinamibacterales bacterium]
MPIVTDRPAAAATESWLDRSLSLFTEVRAGEGATALLLAANIFCILLFYSLLKVVRESLILSEGGAVVKSYSAAGQALLLLGIVPLYGAFASSVNRLRLICGVTLFFASHLIIFYLLGSAGFRVGIAFYLWIGIFNMMMPAQFWAFANDLFSTERGRRLFPIVGMGASLGAVLGAGLATKYFAGAGPYLLMLIAAGGLMLPIVLTLWVNRRERDSGRDKAAAAAEQPLGKAGGFQLVFQQRYLLLIAMLLVTLNLINTIGEFLLADLITSEAKAAVASGTAGGLDERALIGTMAGGVQTSVNLLGLLFQAFLVSRVLKYIGVRGALFILPLIALGSYSLMALLPIFGIVRVAKILENSTDYSIQNTTRQALFLPTSREAKYKAKQAIDSFFVRFGDMLQAVVVFVGTGLAFSLRHFAVLNIVFVAIALAIVVGISREYKRLTAEVASDQAA